MWKQVSEWLPIGTSFASAASTYGLFHFLDNVASGPARRAISEWIVGMAHANIDARQAVVSVFDRVYTRPLFRLEALFRSFFITTVLYIIFFGIFFVSLLG